MLRLYCESETYTLSPRVWRGALIVGNCVLGIPFRIELANLAPGSLIFLPFPLLSPRYDEKVREPGNEVDTSLDEISQLVITFLW